MVEVFKTNVNNKSDACEMVEMLIEHFTGHKISFDLEDCDKILRVESDNVNSDGIISILQRRGFQCEVLEDLVLVN
jgi:hypothetical protein